MTDGKLVYAYFGAEGLYAYDFDGTLAWKARLGGIATFGVGVGTSPVLHGDLVILQCDEDSGEKSFIAALDKNTGKEVWRVAAQGPGQLGDADHRRAGERDELVTSGDRARDRLRPRHGQGAVADQGLESNAVPSPVAGDGVVVVSAGYPAKLAMAIAPGGSGDVTGTPRVLWKYTRARPTCPRRSSTATTST